MRTDLFDFALPEDRIALAAGAPARFRAAAGGASECGARRPHVRDLPDLLRAGDALVVNDTKVIPASLHGRRIGRGDREPAIAATLIKRLDGSRWLALVRPAKRLAVGDVVRFGSEGRVCFLDQLDATVEAKGEGGEVTFRFRLPRRRCLTRRWPSAATCRCRPISPAAAMPTSRTAPTTRPCSRARKARSRRRPRGCISPTRL